MNNKAADQQKPQNTGLFRSLLHWKNRGLLLDLTVFVANVFLMRLLVKYFFNVAHAAAAGDKVAAVLIGGYCLALFLFAPIGAVLKRWQYHQQKHESDPTNSGLAGCLFNPIFYFCLMFVIFALIDAFAMQYISPEGQFSAGIVLSSMLLGTTATIVHTWLVYRYFTPPKHPPASAFLRSPAAGLVGDVFIFVNMLNFQIIWNTLAMVPMGHPSGIEEFAGRLLVFSFIALLIYFPPRMFYLADDIDKGRTWLMMLLANSPILYHLFVGTNLNAPFGW